MAATTLHLLRYGVTFTTWAGSGRCSSRGRCCCTGEVHFVPSRVVLLFERNYLSQFAPFLSYCPYKLGFRCSFHSWCVIV